MITIYQENQEQQYKLAKEGMDRYNGMLRTADYATRHGRAQVVRSIDDFLRQIQGQRVRGIDGVREDVEKLRKELVADATKGAELLEGEKVIEVLINQYNGKPPEVILPVRQEDLTTERSTLLDKLYAHCEKVLEDQWSVQSAHFEGYIVFSLEDPADRKEVAKALLQHAPKEFQGNPLYVRVANNFSFSYQTTAAREAREKPLDRTPPPTSLPHNTLTREDAITLFIRGMTSQQIHAQHPGTLMWTIAGWKSWWSKGKYSGGLK